MPAFVKNPKFIIGTVVVLWVLYVIYKNFEFAPIHFHLLPFVLIEVKLSTLIIAAMIFGALATLLIQWLWRRPVEVVTVVPPSAPRMPSPAMSSPTSPTTSSGPSSRTVA